MVSLMTNLVPLHREHGVVAEEDIWGAVPWPNIPCTWQAYEVAESRAPSIIAVLMLRCENATRTH